jgi:hypothetical protein
MKCSLFPNILSRRRKTLTAPSPPDVQSGERVRVRGAFDS